MKLKCPVTWLSVPIVQRRASKKLQKKPGRRRFGVQRMAVKITKKDQADSLVYMQLPCLNPLHLFQCIADTGAWGLLQAPDWDWSSFWQNAGFEDWGAMHPVTQRCPEDQRRCIAVSVHGDEGQAKRQRSTLVLSWSSLAVHGKSELTKFPFCAPWFHRRMSSTPGLRSSELTGSTTKARRM